MRMMNKPSVPVIIIDGWRIVGRDGLPLMGRWRQGAIMRTIPQVLCNARLRMQGTLLSDPPGEVQSTMRSKRGKTAEASSKVNG